MALGLLTLAFLRTDANVLNFTVSTCIVSMLLGITLLVAGMYGKVGTSDEQEAWEQGRSSLNRTSGPAAPGPQSGMAHIPVNHPLRPLYRVLAALVGAYVLVFGIIGLVRTWGDDLFARDSVWVLGLRTNLAFALLSVIFGAVILLADVVGGNVDHLVNLACGGHLHGGRRRDDGVDADRRELPQLLDVHRGRLAASSACCCSRPASTARSAPPRTPRRRTPSGTTRWRRRRGHGRAPLSGPGG